MKTDIGRVLTRLRQERGLSQSEAASLMRLEGFSVTNQAVSKWETGQTTPSAAQFLALCRIYDVEDVMRTFSAARGRRQIDRLNAEGKRLVGDYIRVLAASGLYAAETERESAVRLLPVYLMRTSAGTGEMPGEGESELTEVGPDVPQGADFGVRISGDSMSPRYEDGQTVWLRRQETLENGELGVFLLGGKSYFKKLDLTGGRPRLISLNSAYAPIEPQSELRVFGRVL